jgi:carbon-monoxide dehydrogenase large subunit
VSAPAHGRREDVALVTGRGNYVGNLRRDGMLHCAFARGSVAHGRIEGVSVARAVDVGGVVAAVTANDLDLRPLRGRFAHLDESAT